MRGSARTWRDAAEDRHGTSIMWNAHGTSPTMNMGKVYEKARMVAPTMLTPRHMQMVRTSPSRSTMRLTSIITANVSSTAGGRTGRGVYASQSVNMPLSEDALVNEVSEDQGPEEEASWGQEGMVSCVLGSRAIRASSSPLSLSVRAGTSP